MAEKAVDEIRAMQTAHKALAGLQPAEQARVLSWLYQKLGLDASTTTVQTTIGSGLGNSETEAAGKQSNTSSISGTPGTATHARAFMSSKKPKNIQERVACLAYYLTRFKNMPLFNTRDISQMNTDAGQSNLTNASVFMKNTVKAQYLSSAGKGARQLTPRGEALVDALPDRNKVTEALAEHPLSGRRKRGGRGNKRPVKSGS